ncbi:MAG: homoserine dehydrogenase [Chitinivibrionales bacterium]
MERPVGVGVAGAGTIGGGVIKILKNRIRELEKDPGVVLKGTADKNTSVFKSLPVDGVKTLSDAEELLNDSGIDIVVELIGGTGYARDYVLKALENKKHVVTANKALLAEHGPEIFRKASENGVSLYYEAAVGGGIPVIKALRESLSGNRIESVKTIINGTSNYILTEMTEKGEEFGDVLKRAQDLGYAEADPGLDIEGGDAGHKSAIMASIITKGYVAFEDVHMEGIKEISPLDVDYASELGYVIKLLGIINNTVPVDVRVHPVMLRQENILASVNGSFNAVLINGDAVDDVLLYGRGAGEMPTASAVVGDIIDIARNIKAGDPLRIPSGFYTEENRLKVKPVSDLESRYYMRFTVIDRPGVLSAITKEFGKRDISIASVIQKQREANKAVPVIITTHSSKEAFLREAVSEIEGMTDIVRDKTCVIRIEK